MRTSFIGEGLSGRIGGVVYVRSRQGTLLRSMPASRTGGPTEKEYMGQLQTSWVGDAWGRLDPEAMGRWRRYAELQTAARPPERRTVTNGWNEYLALGKKLMQIDGIRDLPERPPEGRFLGDLVFFGVEPYAEGKETGVRFLASRPNEAGVLTECLLQRLANGGRLPTARGYRSQGFLQIEEDLRMEAPAFPGWWACATRFVEASTGRVTALVPCGIVFVGRSAA